MIKRKFTSTLFLITLIAQGILLGDFPKPTNTQKTDLTLPTPEEAVKGMSLPDGFKINCFASEPMIRQPIAMAFDDRNRLWVAECYTYAEARTNFDLKLRDRIVILEDVNGDGRADKKTIFHDDLQRLTGLTVGFAECGQPAPQTFCSSRMPTRTTGRTESPKSFWTDGMTTACATTWSTDLNGDRMGGYTEDMASKPFRRWVRRGRPRSSALS